MRRTRSKDEEEADQDEGGRGGLNLLPFERAIVGEDVACGMIHLGDLRRHFPLVQRLPLLPVQNSVLTHGTRSLANFVLDVLLHVGQLLNRFLHVPIRLFIF